MTAINPKRPLDAPLAYPGARVNGRIGVVLVNYRGWRDTLECIRSLQAVQYEPGLDVIVVDNGSGDESGQRIRAAFPNVQLLEMGRNLGFAGGCNVGMRAARQRGNEFIWLLNNDTIVDPQAPQALVEIARARPDAAFYGTIISIASTPERIWFARGMFDRRTGAITNVDYDQPVSDLDGDPRPVHTDWISGCSVLIRASTLDDIGFLNEDFFLYKEELEWQLRRPHSAWVVPRALVHHKGGQTGGGTGEVLGRVFMSRNFLKLARRYAGGYLPLWLGRWVVYFVVGPALKGHLRLAWAGLAGITEQRTPGASIVERWRGERIK